MSMTEASIPSPTGAGEAEAIIKTCINCGCCNSGCPTFDLLGDELDSPRGRINLIKEMMKEDGAPDAETVLHIDRCLSCNSCLTSCPSDVDYMHLVDFARSHIEKTYRRPILDRMLRAMLAAILPDPDRFRLALAVARPFRGLAPVVSSIPGFKPYAALLAATPKKRLSRSDEIEAGVFAPDEAKKRVLIPSGCVQRVLDPEINRSAIRVLNAAGVAVTLPDDDNCCGALVLHLGKEAAAKEQARRNVDAWYPHVECGLDAIVITTSGCGTTIKDYGHLLADDPAYREKAAAVAGIARDISEFLTEMSPKGGRKVHFLAKRRMEADLLIEKVGAELRGMMSWLQKPKE